MCPNTPDRPLPVPQGEPHDVPRQSDKETPDTQQSHESGIVSPEKNKILEQHSKDFPEGDPAVRRVNPSRDEIGVKVVRKPKLDSEKKPA